MNSEGKQFLFLTIKIFNKFIKKGKKYKSLTPYKIKLGLKLIKGEIYKYLGFFL